MTPDVRDLREVERELLLVLHDREALGERLHEAILDPVVHHLREVPAAGWADVSPPLVGRRRERLEDRAQPFDGIFLAADHQAVSLGEAPDAAARADVDEGEAA